MKQIVCISHTPWSTRPNRTQQILTRLPDTQVLFFEPPLPEEKNIPRRAGLRVRSNIVIYSLPVSLEKAADRRRVQLRVSSFIQKTMDHYRFREPILWCTIPRCVFLLDQLAYRCVVYDCHREWDGLPLEWESELAIAADVIFAASPGLAKRLSPCSENIVLLPNGANPQMFLRDDLAAPKTLLHCPLPIFARVGDVTSDLEIAPAMFAAQWRPQWTFAFIGRVSRKAGEVLSALPNVVLTGQVPAVELPDYLLPCQVLFDLIRTRRQGDIIPSRIYEYFCTGKPVVSMVAMNQPDPFPDAIYTAYDANGFLRCCQEALAEENPAVRRRRLAYAREASWSARAQEVFRILGSI